MGNRWFEALSIKNLFQPKRVLPEGAEAMFHDPVEADDLRADREHGASGTDIQSGMVQQDEYNPLMMGKQFFTTVDKMRKPDGSIKAALAVMKLPIIRTPARILPMDGVNDKEDVAIAEIAHRKLMNEDVVHYTWKEVLRNILLMLDFGFSVDEKIWTIDDDQIIRPDRIAPRLPRTIENFHLTSQHELTVIQQATKNGRNGLWKIPAPLYASVYSWEKEGDNFWGQSVLRPMYKHWFYKEELYRIDAVRLDRWGTGIPKAKIAKGYTMKEGEKNALTKMLSSLRGSDRAFIYHPEEVDVNLLTPSGTAGDLGLMTSVNHHDAMIFRSILAHFITAAQSEHGNYGSTSSFIDMFLYAEQAVAYFIEDEFTRQVVRPFCDLNFDMRHGARPYPRLKFNNIEYIDMERMSTALQRMTQGKIVEPDNELEAEVRRLFGWPVKGTPRKTEESTEDPKLGQGRPTDPDAGRDRKVNQGDPQE